MKRLFCFLTLALAFVGNAMAWEPVIKERHWFGGIEYDEDNNPNATYGGLNFQINWNGNDIASIQGYAQYHQGDSYKPKTQTTFNCWLDDSGNDPKPRFGVNVTGNWEVGKNNSNTYHGLGLKVKESVGSSNGTNFRIKNLDAGDKFSIEYYRVANASRMPFLVSGTVTGRTTSQNWSSDSQIAGNVEYTCPNGGEVVVNMPGGTVIRGITIIHAVYQKATTEIKQIRDNQNNIGYEMTVTGAGILEDKRGAVPYITMRYGAENDMTYAKFLGTVNGVKQYGTASVVDASNNLEPNSAVMMDLFRNHGEQWTRNKLVGKEWTVFMRDENLPTDNDQRFNSIYPLYGTYYYFFPEVNGKFHVRFYCEGDGEHMPFWYKLDGNGNPVPVSGQSVTNVRMSTDNGNSYNSQNFGGNNNYNTKYYEYTADLKKGGVYYLCSNPNNYHMERPIVRLISYSFIPEFRVDPLYKVVGNATPSVQGAATIKGVTISEFTGLLNNNELDKTKTIKINGEDAPMIKFLGRVKDATVSLRQAGDDIKLDISNITYEDGDAINQGGAIVVNLDCPAGKATFVLTIAYSASKAEWGKDADGNDVRVATNETGNVEVKCWDFYSGKGEYGAADWDLGKYSNTSSKLHKEIHKADGLTADWVETYADVQNSKEKIFKSVYDMEGDNADMIHETAGLVFHTSANQMGIFNENDAPTNGFQDRYVGLMSGSKLVIPRLQADDRVVIKMGSFGNADGTVATQNATIRLTNAKDAKGTPISASADYVIGGSIPYPDETGQAKTQPHGEYHFIVAETSTTDDTDFAIEVTDATELLKIYSITIYRNDDILTENQLIGNVAEVTFTDDDAENSTKTLDAHVRYHGYQEISGFDDVDQQRGNLAIDKNNFTVTTSSEEPYCTISTTVEKGDFGSARAKMEVLTKDASNSYVTDYVPGSLAVGLLEKVKDGYPYTWDFTDLLKLEYNNSTYIHDAIDFEKNAGNLLPDYKGWEDYTGQSLRNAPKNASGILFADGGQLYAKNELFAETAGIGFKRSTDKIEDAKLLNRSVRIRDGALVLNCNEDGKFHKMVLPKVDADGVVYVRATPIENAKLKAKCSKDGITEAKFDKTLTVGEDSVFIMKNDAERDVELWLNGYEIKKIAVATDFKKIGSTGYATESRDHIIDHRLTEYFTGVPVKAYYGKLSDDKKSVSLEKVEFLKAAVNEGDPTGCILHNETSSNNKAVNIINDGFHLFVPDMHDNGSSAINGNVLLAHTTDGNITNESGLTRYVLSNKWYSPGDDGKQNLNTDLTKVRFVKVDHSTGAKLSANSAYMELSKEAGAKIANIMLFYDESEEPSGEATGIVTVNHENEKKDVWYNLSGLPIEAPSKAGIYIRNGKKVVVK